MFLVQKLSWALQEKQEPIHFHGKNEISLIREDLVYRKKSATVPGSMHEINVFFGLFMFILVSMFFFSKWEHYLLIKHSQIMYFGLVYKNRSKTVNSFFISSISSRVHSFFSKQYPYGPRLTVFPAIAFCLFFFFFYFFSLHISS